MLTNKLGAILILLSGVGCAGPTTPLGAIWAVLPSEVTQPQSFPDAKVRVLAQNHSKGDRAPASGAGAPILEVTPSKQLLHGPAPLKLSIHDPSGDLVHFDLWVRYNGFDVSRNFVAGSKVLRDWDQRTLLLENGNIRLPATSEHQIEFVYRNNMGEMAYLRYEPPSCYAFRPQTVQSTGEFRPPKALLSMIEKSSSRAGFSPTFITALVAQESSFNSKRVSWSKALGLTQVTSLAEEEIIAEFEGWPRYPGVESMSVASVKALVMAGKINRYNEWRLDPTRSIQGGVAFALKVAERWSSPENMAKINSTFDDPEIEHTRLILASYHSGYSRVQSAVAKYGKKWLSAPTLKEARKYVNSIFSYCHFFAETEDSYVEAS